MKLRFGCPQPTALVVKLVYSTLFESTSPDVAHMVMCSLLIVGLVCIVCVPKKYRRREAERLAGQDDVKDAKDAVKGKDSNGAGVTVEDVDETNPETTRLAAVD